MGGEECPPVVFSAGPARFRPVPCLKLTLTCVEWTHMTSVCYLGLFLHRHSLFCSCLDPSGLYEQRGPLSASVLRPHCPSRGSKGLQASSQSAGPGVPASPCTDQRQAAGWFQLLSSSISSSPACLCLYRCHRRGLEVGHCVPALPGSHVQLSKSSSWSQI